MIFSSSAKTDPDAMGQMQEAAIASMYPCTPSRLSHDSVHEESNIFWADTQGASHYGVVHTGSATVQVDGISYKIQAGQYFAFSGRRITPTGISRDFHAAAFTRLGYRVPCSVGQIEIQGRLSYIDGCSDSLLVYPSRKGDPSLNLLYFPPGIEQTFHSHPSIRLGTVLSGEGTACYGAGITTDLKPGTIFMLPQMSRHRFCTADSEMRIAAFHPDGDWGPEDHNHTMLNRTYLTK